MKKLLILAAVLLPLLAGCGKPEDNKETKADVTGVWELSAISTKASIGSETVSVYLDFVAGGTFTLYQKIGAGRYTRFEGTYSLSDENVLSGSYSDGSAWGPYKAERDGSTLKLTSSGEKETDTYKLIDAIPEAVLENVY